MIKKNCAKKSLYKCKGVFLCYNKIMIPDNLLKILKEKYTTVHPLIFYRSKDRVKTAGELFDILDTMPTEFPIVWNEENKRWVTTKDLFQAKAFPKG